MAISETMRTRKGNNTERICESVILCNVYDHVNKPPSKEQSTSIDENWEHELVIEGLNWWILDVAQFATERRLEQQFHVVLGCHGNSVVLTSGRRGRLAARRWQHTCCMLTITFTYS